MRRIGDVVMACALLGLTLPLLIIVALAIKWESRGPVFDKRACIVLGGRRFQRLSFRVTEYEPEEPEWARRQTRIGQLLYYSRIESLPQLINVLRGEMSLIEDTARYPFFLD
jgi:lipopolysaccharide/colanic/teichoic acid biosynthesis glycosyltransferase